MTRFSLIVSFSIFLLIDNFACTLAISADKDNLPTVPSDNCQMANTAIDALANSYDALRRNDWNEYAKFLGKSDLEQFKQTNLNLLNAVSPDNDCMVLYEKIICKKSLEKITPTEAFEFFMSNLLANSPPLSVFNYLDSFIILDTLSSSEEEVEYLMREYFNMPEGSTANDMPVRVSNSGDCWEVSIHSIFDFWILSTERVIDYRRPMSEKN